MVHLPTKITKLLDMKKTISTPGFDARYVDGVVYLAQDNIEWRFSLIPGKVSVEPLNDKLGKGYFDGLNTFRLSVCVRNWDGSKYLYQNMPPEFYPKEYGDIFEAKCIEFMSEIPTIDNEMEAIFHKFEESIRPHTESYWMSYLANIVLITDKENTKYHVHLSDLKIERQSPGHDIEVMTNHEAYSFLNKYLEELGEIQWEKSRQRLQDLKKVLEDILEKL